MAFTFKHFLGQLRRLLRVSSRIHIREERVSSLEDLVDLIDRFIDGKMKYDLEWDDFISWNHNNNYIESVRVNLAMNEGILFSKNNSDREKYISILIVQRNSVAAIIGLSARER